MIARRSLVLVVSFAIALSVCAALVWAFAEEPVTFRDPSTLQPFDEETSTIHEDLTRILALAAGFSESDTARLVAWDQLVDSEQLGPGDAVSYTNCSGSFHAPPEARAVCNTPVISPLNHAIWPMAGSMKDADTCATSRFGVYSPFFHFPRDNANELGALRQWAWGMTDTLAGYEAYAWGGPLDMTVMRANCLYTRTAVIDTGIAAGSLEAFATYLHSLADHYSHRDCIAAMDALGMPWATHTLTDVEPCNYNPNNMTNTDVHGREFFTYTDSARTDEAIRRLYSELVTRSVQREGSAHPLGMDTVLIIAEERATEWSRAPALAYTLTLSQALYNFVHTWEYSQAMERRAYGDQLVLALRALPRAPVRRVFLPITMHP